MQKTLKENHTVVYDDNITIGQIFNILFNQKSILIITIVLSMVLSTAYLLLVKPVYESRAVIAIGKVTVTQPGTTQSATTQSGALEDPLLLMQRIKEKYKLGDTTDGGKTMPMLTSIEIDKKIANNIVILKAQANSPKEAQECLGSVVTPLLEEHQKLYSKYKSLQENRILLLEQELKNSEKETSEFLKQSHVLVNQDSAMAALLLIEKARLDERRIGLQKLVNEEKATVSEINTKPTELLREPTLPINPTKSKLMIIILAGVLGIFLGIMLAFTKEYIESRNKTMNIS